ncbi:hypothetical protein PR048_016498 [Dryococelus australis]|uniref:PiggyBac transposable element-derived protein domain-containing protein n=1 Tax=Dryococelus australis TaxID=614101 RepID=A0ABQ9HJV5_9NEOP|nr:hypothetical protein PR048_016498 [Dryococelus australis]
MMNFGIKFLLEADVDTKYLLSDFPYLGKDDNRRPNQSLPEHVIMKRMAPYLGKDTVNRALREIPQSVKTRKDPLYDTVELKNNEPNLTVHQGKNNKNDLKHLPQTVSFYNATKYGVVVLDQTARKYSLKAASRCWPVQVCYNILDLAEINAWVLIKQITGRRISWRVILQMLSVELHSASAHGHPKADMLGCVGERRKEKESESVLVRALATVRIRRRECKDWWSMKRTLTRIVRCCSRTDIKS